jgi:hypothetical protein
MLCFGSIGQQFPTDQYQSANAETAFHITNLQLRGILGGLFALAASHSRLVSAPKYKPTARPRSREGMAVARAVGGV